MINFRRCTFFHFLRGFIFVGGEILIILCELIFEVTKYVIFMPIILLKEKEQFSTKLLKIYHISNGYSSQFNLLKSRIFLFKTERVLNTNSDKNFAWVDFGG